MKVDPNTPAEYLRIGDSLDITVPPCGHPYCFGFMGCVPEYRKKLGVKDEPGILMPPGTILEVKIVHLTGFPERDWEFV